MISPKLYKSSSTYDFFMKLLGYERGIDRFLQTVPLEVPAQCRILDVGCGTGLLGLHFLDRFSDARLHATDLEPNFLRATLANAEKRDIDRARIDVAVSNVSDPAQVTTLDGMVHSLPQNSFHIVCLGAVVGYADNIEHSLRNLVALLAPGGYLINIEMNESPTGRFVSHRYHYRNIPLHRMHEVIRSEGCDVSTRKLSVTHLPAKLTRTAIIARKTRPLTSASDSSPPEQNNSGSGNSGGPGN
ncbi:MAG: class I SAM-dependent methyltransferase [Planctomycetaceae bacterium]